MNQTLKNKCALVTGGSRTSEPPSSNVWPGKFCDFGTGRGEPHSWLRRCYQPPPPFANPLPARVPASAPRKVPIYLRLLRSVEMGDSRSGYRTGKARSPTARCLAGRAATPPEECGGSRGYMRILDQRKYYPPMAEQELVEKALRHRGSAAGPGSSRLAQGVARNSFKGISR